MDLVAEVLEAASGSMNDSVRLLEEKKLQSLRRTELVPGGPCGPPFIIIEFIVCPGFPGAPGGRIIFGFAAPFSIGGCCCPFAPGAPGVKPGIDGVELFWLSFRRRF